MSKLNDLTGQVFGNLTVIERAENYISPKGNTLTQWLCKCICGNTTIVTTVHLKRKHTTSCGCQKNIGQSKKDLTGRTFGRLTVIEDFGRTKQGGIIWKCVCECGNITYINSNNLIRGLTQSCGCLHKEITSANYIDLTNQQFGKLTVIHKVNKTINGNIKWLCKCECGTLINVASGNLLSGHTQSCGCIQSLGEEKISKLLAKYNSIYVKQYTFSQLGKLRFDFGILDVDNNLQYLIEFDGRQHFGFTNEDWNTEENYNNVHRRDLIKNQYCFDNNIPLIRIPYTHLNKLKIDDLMLETTSFLLTKVNEQTYYII